MPATNFNLQTTIYLLQRKWKQVLLFVALSLVVATITLWLMPKYYRSTATLVAANPALADKARLFNTNIEGLYSYFGSGDDLDRLVGIASMDTVLKQLVDEFDLIKYYQLTNQTPALLRRKAVLELKDDLTLQKTDLGQLKLIIWTKQPALSANIINRLVAITQTIEEGIWKKRYDESLNKLNTSIAQMEQEYTTISEANNGLKQAAIALQVSKQNNLLEQINGYQKAANEFKLALQNNTPALYVMEKAVPAAKSEKPNKLAVLLATFLSSLVFASLGLLVYHREPVF